MDEYTTVKFELEDMTLEFFRPELERMFPNFDVWEVSPQRVVYRKTARGTTEALDLHVTQHRPNALRGMLIYPGKFTALADSILGWVEQSYGAVMDQAASTVANATPDTPSMTDKERYWRDVIRQAEASGNVSQYLRDKDIPSSTYYENKTKYGLRPVSGNLDNSGGKPDSQSGQLGGTLKSSEVNRDAHNSS